MGTRAGQLLWIGFVLTGLTSTGPAGCTPAESDPKAAAPDATTEAPQEPEPRVVTFSGTVILNSEVDDVDPAFADGLAAGQGVEGASVFLKGFPDATAASDAQGAFTLAIEVPGDQLQQGDEYSLVAWYSTEDGTPTKFGVQQTVVATPEMPAALGDVAIGFTKKARFFPKDNGTTLADRTTACTIVMPDYLGRIAVAASAGELEADYLPPAEYRIAVECDGYHPVAATFTVDPATSPGTWFAVDVAVTPL